MGAASRFGSFRSSGGSTAHPTTRRPRCRPWWMTATAKFAMRGDAPFRPSTWPIHRTIGPAPTQRRGGIPCGIGNDEASMFQNEVPQHGHYPIPQSLYEKMLSREVRLWLALTLWRDARAPDTSARRGHGVGYGVVACESARVVGKAAAGSAGTSFASECLFIAVSATASCF